MVSGFESFGLSAFNDVGDVPKILAKLLLGSNVLFIPTTTKNSGTINHGWEPTVVGTGYVECYPFYLFVATNTTANSSAKAFVAVFGFGGVDEAEDNKIDWTKEIYFIWNHWTSNSDAQSVSYVYLSNAGSDGLTDLAAGGIGLKVNNFTMYGHSYGVSAADVDLGVVASDSVIKQVVIHHQPSVPKIDFYINGVLKGSQTTSAKIPQTIDTGGGAQIYVGVKNGATGTVNKVHYFAQPRLWQSRT